MTLLAPLFLLGLLGIGIPIFIHRLHEQRAVVRPFPSSLLLEETRQTTTRHRRIRFRWLLASRILMLAILSILFAQPLLWLTDSLLEDRAEIHLFVVDDSFSMRHGERWQQALTTVGSMIDSAAEGVTVVLTTASSPAANIPGVYSDGDSNPTTDNSVSDGTTDSNRHSQARAELNRLRATTPTNLSLDYVKLMDRVERFAENRQTPVHLHLFSDMQRSSAVDGINRLYRQDLAAVTLHSVGDRGDHNVALDAQVAWLDTSNAYRIICRKP